MGIEIKPQPPMPDYRVYYDKQNDVICIDYGANIILTEAIFAHVIEDVAKLSPTLSHKVFAVANLNGSTIDADLQQNYEKYYSGTLQHVRGVVRYNVTNLLTSVTIRSTTVTKRLQGSQSHIYRTKEAAIAAVRRLEQLEPPPA
jgi:hypothetical protein